MWTKRKLDNFPSFGDSWEEQAFAEDASGHLGGCIWPPRSYSCSFCRREFKSAQALGGHMNVHRRDRARLKQSPPIPNAPAAASASEVLPDQNHHMFNSCTSFAPQICTYLYNNRSTNSDQGVIRVSGPPTKMDGEDYKKNNFWSNLVGDESFHVSDLKNDDKKGTSSKSWDLSNGRAKSSNNNVKAADLSVSLNLLVCRKRTNNASVDDEEEEMINYQSSKRRKIDDASNSFISLFPRSSNPTENCHSLPQYSEVLKISSSSIEDLDLELRLGDPPKVK